MSKTKSKICGAILAFLGLIDSVQAVPIPTACNFTIGPAYRSGKYSNGNLALCQNTTSVIQSRAAIHGGFKNVAYLPNWSLYHYNLQDLPVHQLTHVMYTFAKIDPSGQVALSDLWVDLQKSMYGGTQGLLESLFEFKKTNRNLKTMLSIGGAGSDGNKITETFVTIIADPSKRARFVESAIAVMAEHGFDGIDVDFEYPENSEQGHGFTLLMQELQASQLKYSQTHANNYHFEIGAAISAGNNARNIEFGALNGVVDSWHVMAYDFKGDWEKDTGTAGHQANLRMHPSSAITSWSIESSIDMFLKMGVPSQKLVLGIPLYGQAFVGTDGLGMPFKSAHTRYGYKDLPRPGANVGYDAHADAAYSYDYSQKELVSFDNPDSVKVKAQYVRDNNLSGAMWWEISNDKTGPDSLVGAVAGALGNLWEQKQNLLCYPNASHASMREEC